jgi:hypothetical protein
MIGRFVPVQRTAHRPAALFQDMRIDHGRAHVLVDQQFLDGADIISVLQQVGGKAVPEGMAADRLVNAGNLYGGFDGLGAMGTSMFLSFTTSKRYVTRAKCHEKRE